MYNQSTKNSPREQPAHEALAASPGETNSYPVASPSLGADRLRGFHIDSESSSFSGQGSPIYTPQSVPSTNETAAHRGLSGPLAESYHYTPLQDASKKSARSCKSRSNKKSPREVDTLSNIARGSSRGTGTSSPAHLPDLQPSGAEQAEGSEAEETDGSDSAHGVDKSDEPCPSSARDQSQSMHSLDKINKYSGILLQATTNVITEDQLINEIQAIYAGILMVEGQIIQFHQRQNNQKNEIRPEQWQALIALHRTLIQEHYDFFLASFHPLATATLRLLPENYSMTARLWRYGIHSLLELLRKNLPGSHEYMITFIYTAYSLMTLFLETIPAFKGTWIECLGDLARYRMAVEGVDMHYRDTWSLVSKSWYTKAADKHPEIGRLQHHQAVLARPNLIQQLFYYSKALISLQPFTNARDSISLVFQPLLESTEPVHSCNPPVLVTFVKIHGLFFNRGNITQSVLWTEEFLGQLSSHITSIKAVFREHGAFMVSANYVAIFDYGHADGRIFPMFDTKKFRKPTIDLFHAAYKHWQTKPRDESIIQLRKVPEDTERFWSSDHTVSFASYLAFSTLDIILQHTENRTVLPSVHLSLAFLWCTALVPKCMELIQADVPWKRVTSFLNSLIKPETDVASLAREDFPKHERGSAQQLPEDFLIRGLAWSQPYHPPGFFNHVENFEERCVEPRSAIIPRTRRCLWLGLQLAKLKCWIVYDDQQRRFTTTEFAEELSALAEQYPVIAAPGVSQYDADITMGDS